MEESILQFASVCSVELIFILSKVKLTKKIYFLQYMQTVSRKFITDKSTLNSSSISTSPFHSDFKMFTACSSDDTSQKSPSQGALILTGWEDKGTHVGDIFSHKSDITPRRWCWVCLRQIVRSGDSVESVVFHSIFVESITHLKSI